MQALEKLQKKGESKFNKAYDWIKGNFVERVPVVSKYVNVIESMENEVDMLML
jgi:hypothetical protein